MYKTINTYCFLKQKSFIPQVLAEMHPFFSNTKVFGFCEKDQLAVHQTNFLFFSGIQLDDISQKRPEN